MKYLIQLMVLADDPRCGDLNREDYALALDPAGVNNQHLHQAHQARELNEEGILSTLHELVNSEEPFWYEQRSS